MFVWEDCPLVSEFDGVSPWFHRFSTQSYSLLLAARENDHLYNRLKLTRGPAFAPKIPGFYLQKGRKPRVFGTSNAICGDYDVVFQGFYQVFWDEHLCSAGSKPVPQGGSLLQDPKVRCAACWALGHAVGAVLNLQGCGGEGEDEKMCLLFVGCFQSVVLFEFFFLGVGGGWSQRLIFRTDTWAFPCSAAARDLHESIKDIKVQDPPSALNAFSLRRQKTTIFS